MEEEQLGEMTGRKQSEDGRKCAESDGEDERRGKSKNNLEGENNSFAISVCVIQSLLRSCHATSTCRCSSVFQVEEREVEEEEGG